MHTTLIFFITCSVCSATPPGTTVPVAGSMGICPEIKSIPFCSTAWLYGPIGAGALSEAVGVVLEKRILKSERL